MGLNRKRFERFQVRYEIRKSNVLERSSRQMVLGRAWGRGRAGVLGVLTKNVLKDLR